MLEPAVIQSLSYPEEAPSCSPNECCGYLDRSEQCMNAGKVITTLNANQSPGRCFGDSMEVGVVDDLEAILVNVGFVADI